MDDNDGHLRILQKQTPTFFSFQFKTFRFLYVVMSLSHDGDNHFEQSSTIRKNTILLL